jgi:hypothetical protein
MPKRLYSILRVYDPAGYVNFDGSQYVVCETLQDEKDVIRNAENAGLRVVKVVAAESCCAGIFLNDFTN